MADATITVMADTSGLRRAIPEIVAFGRRTVAEQCITSAAYISRKAMELTKATPLSRIDSDMQATLSPARLNSGMLSKNKRRQQEVVDLPDRSRADMIVVSRMNPNSKFNQRTGGRWFIPTQGGSSKAVIQAFAKAYGGENAMAKFFEFVRPYAQRMVKARRSSANYLKSGWKAAIRQLFSHPDFKGLRRRSSLSGDLNQLNSLQGDMGGIEVSGLGADSVTVLAGNSVGESVGKSNQVLAAKHRAALIEHGLPALQQAILIEEQEIDAEVRRRLEAGVMQLERKLN